MGEAELATALLRLYAETPDTELEEAPDAEHWLRVAAEVTLQRQRAFHAGFREGLASARDHLRPDPFGRPRRSNPAPVLVAAPDEKAGPGYCFRFEPCGGCHRCTPPPPGRPVERTRGHEEDERE